MVALPTPLAVLKLNCVKLMYKNTQGNIHKYHASKLYTNYQLYKKDTRQKHDVKIIGNKHSNLSKINTLNYKIGTSWNQLPLKIKETSSLSIVSIGTFSKSVKTLMISKYSGNHKCGDKNCFCCKDLN